MIEFGELVEGGVTSRDWFPEWWWWWRGGVVDVISGERTRDDFDFELLRGSSGVRCNT